MNARRMREKREMLCGFNRTSSVKPLSMSPIFCVGTLIERKPLYLADPYFLPYLDEKTGEASDLVQLYLELFAATTDRSLRILCAQKKQGDARPWWEKYPKPLSNHVSVRGFFKRDPDNPDESKRGFHDRYLITPEHEIIITNSLNGWREHGVTFISHRQGVYRAEADNLWALNLQSAAEPLWVEEIS